MLSCIVIDSLDHGPSVLSCCLPMTVKLNSPQTATRKCQNLFIVRFLSNLRIGNKFHWSLSTGDGNETKHGSPILVGGCLFNDPLGLS